MKIQVKTAETLGFSSTARIISAPSIHLISPYKDKYFRRYMYILDHKRNAGKIWYIHWIELHVCFKTHREPRVEDNKNAKKIKDLRFVEMFSNEI